MNESNIAKIIGNLTCSDSLKRINDIMANLPDIPHVSIPEQLIDHPVLMEAQRIAKELSENITSLLPSPSNTAQNILAEMTHNTLEFSAFKAGISALSNADIINASAAAINSLDTTIHTQDNELCVDLSESLADLISSIDDSIDLPEADSENIVQIRESSNSATFWNVVSLIISIISIFVSIYFGHSTAMSSSKQHSELMHKEQEQTEEAKKQTLEEQKQTEQQIQQTEIMKQIQESISNNSNNNAQAVESFTSQSQ